ncbi:MAG: T9SS type A sorting domain-containing protein [Janthinobacterium lividum]
MLRSITLLFAGLLIVRVAMATTYEVKIGPNGDNSYAPQALPALRVGDAVKFTWVSGVHPTMSDSSPAAWPTFTLSSSNASQTVTFTQAGSYPYHCTIHAGQTGTSYVGMIGSITVQAALATMLGQSPVPALSFFPNPAHGQTTLQVSGPGAADYKVRLSNVLGGEVRRLPVRPENTPAADGVALDLSDLPPGLYFCSLLVNDKTLVTKRLTVL